MLHDLLKQFLKDYTRSQNERNVNYDLNQLMNAVSKRQMILLIDVMIDFKKKRIKNEPVQRI